MLNQEPDSETIETLYHEARGARIVGDDSQNTILSELMSACRKRPKEDTLIVVFDVLPTGFVDSAECYSREEFDERNVSGTFALHVDPEPFVSYASIWEQVESQLRELPEQFS